MGRAQGWQTTKDDGLPHDLLDDLLTPYLEIGGDYREVVPGIHMLELPLPFSLGIVNVWLVRLESGWLLIDTGMQTEACFDALARALEGLSVEWRDIRHILLTHIHPDHLGLATKLVALDRRASRPAPRRPRTAGTADH